MILFIYEQFYFLPVTNGQSHKERSAALNYGALCGDFAAVICIHEAFCGDNTQEDGQKCGARGVRVAGCALVT